MLKCFALLAHGTRFLRRFGGMKVLMGEVLCPKTAQTPFVSSSTARVVLQWLTFVELYIRIRIRQQPRGVLEQGTMLLFTLSALPTFKDLF